jgi:hypothetical protein
MALGQIRTRTARVKHRSPHSDPHPLATTATVEIFLYAFFDMDLYAMLSARYAIQHTGTVPN